MATQEATALALLLKRAQSWQEAEKTHQAIATYFKLVEYFPGTDEAQRARAELFNLAQRLEAEGKIYQATHLYNRLAAIGLPENDDPEGLLALTATADPVLAEIWDNEKDAAYDRV